MAYAKQISGALSSSMGGAVPLKGSEEKLWIAFQEVLSIFQYAHAQQQLGYPIDPDLLNKAHDVLQHAMVDLFPMPLSLSPQLESLMGDVARLATKISDHLEGQMDQEKINLSTLKKRTPLLKAYAQLERQ